MNSLFDILFSQVNIVLTLLLSLLIIYWLLTMISGIDFDYDIDVDIDVDADIHVDSGLEGGNMDFQDISNTEINQEDVVGKRRQPLKWWQVLLIYFNFVGLPFMFTFTCWIFIWWFATTLTTSLTYTYDSPFGFLIMLLALFPSLLLCKWFTTPFKSFFKNLNKDGDKAVDYIGRKAVLLSSISEDKLGNAEVHVDGNSLSVYVKSIDGAPLSYSENILIIKKSQDGQYFLVQSYND